MYSASTHVSHHVRQSTHSDDIVPVLRLVEQTYPIFTLHDRGGGVPQKFGLWLEFAGDEKAVFGTDVRESGYRLRYCQVKPANLSYGMMRDLFGDVKSLCSVLVGIATSEEFAKHRVIPSRLSLRTS